MKKQIAAILATNIMLLSMPPFALPVAGAVDIVQEGQSISVAAVGNLNKVNKYTQGQFIDVPSDNWCADNVRVVYEYGLMNGKTANTFDPDGLITAYEVIAMICRLRSAYNGENVDFSSTGPQWYQPYMDYAVKNHLITSMGDGNMPMARSDLAMLMAIALPEDAYPKINEIPTGDIPDVPYSAAYHDSVYLLYWAGVLTGNDAYGTFTPSQALTRGAAAAIFGRIVDPSLRKQFKLENPVFNPVPMNQLANLSSLRKSMSDSEFSQAYQEALKIVTPYAGLRMEAQLGNVAQALRDMFDTMGSYSMEDAHYNDPYGYLVLHTASCAGCTRATGLCLNILGIPYEHVNENQYTHQWCRVKMNDGTYWICDAYGLFCGEEPAPYEHPYSSLLNIGS